MIFPYIRERLMRPKVEREISFYKETNKHQVLNYQLQKFNNLWETYQVEIPYYKELVEKGEVPSEIKSIEDFKLLPITDREFAKSNIHTLSNGTKKPDKWVTTGGSTATPLKYPSWKEESNYYESSLWYARDLYNIKRSDRMFRIWGHSHVLGSGLSRYKKMLAFKIGHPLIGFKRFSAYDLSNEKLKKAGEEIIKFKPDYIIGYSKALFLLAQANEEFRDEFHNLKLKAVIGAAEGFEREEDREFVGEVFGASVGLEYASMETKLLAHTHPEGGYKVIWRNNLVECINEDGQPSSEGKVLVTSLYPRAFPLVRYELGDIISGTKKDEESVYFFNEVSGRDNDFLMLDDRTPIHSEGITHAIKFSENVTAYQIRYTKDYKYTIYLKGKQLLTAEEINSIRNRLKKVDSRLGKLPIKQTNDLKQTIAGKTRWLIEE